MENAEDEGIYSVRQCSEWEKLRRRHRSQDMKEKLAILVRYERRSIEIDTSLGSM
jgi:hypothetical protein